MIIKEEKYGASQISSEKDNAVQKEKRDESCGEIEYKDTQRK
jgi:hypothetical protein